VNSCAALKRRLSLGLGLGLGSALALGAWQRAHAAGSRAAKEPRFADAEKLLSQSVDEARRLSELSPLLGRSLLDLGELYRTEGRHSEARGTQPEAAGLPSPIIAPGRRI
jgi:hypothetical protein